MRLTLCCVVWLLPGLALAQVYRWTDAEGRVHFGQRPVAGAEPVEVRPQVIERDAATREREARARRFFDAREEERAQAAQQSALRQAEQARDCERIRQQLARMPEGRRYYRREAGGEATFYSDEQLDAARRQLRDQLSSRCS